MITVLFGYPENVVAIECVGKITAEDYRDVLIPEITKRLKANKTIRVLCVIGEGFEGYTPGAAWSDFTFGVSHWNQFERLAVVTDIGWIRDGIAMFTPIFHPMRVFLNSDLAAAKHWILEEGDAR